MEALARSLARAVGRSVIAIGWLAGYSCMTAGSRH